MAIFRPSFVSYLVGDELGLDYEVIYPVGVSSKKPRHKKCKAELFLDSLRQDGAGPKRRKMEFRGYVRNNLSGRTEEWRHSITQARKNRDASLLKKYEEYTKRLGDAIRIAIRTHNDALICAAINQFIELVQHPGHIGFRFPDIKNVIAPRFNSLQEGLGIDECNKCGKYAPRAVGKRVNRRYYCERCARNMPECARCHGPCETQHRILSIELQILCWCDNCIGRAFEWADGSLHEDPMPLNRVGHYHSSLQYMRQIGKPIEGLCSVGFELEFIPFGQTRQRRDEISASLTKLTEIVAGVEEDGSIRHHNGAEIVTHYGALDSVLAGAEKVSAVLKNRAFSHSTNCCGLHVSLGRGGIDNWTLSKFVVFWNSPKNREFLKAFARRWEAGYCKPKAEKSRITEGMSELHVPEDIITCYDRYELVNTQNRNRIECRAFRGTTNPETIKRCLSLCVWLMAYSYETKDRSMSYKDFLEWCKTAKRTRGEDVFTPSILIEFADVKGFLTQSRSRKVVLCK